MGKADFQLDGYQIFWYSSDHDPPHFNIEKVGHWGIKVKFTLSDENDLNFEMVWQNQKRGPSGADQKLFREYISTHRATCWKSGKRKYASKNEPFK